MCDDGFPCRGSRMGAQEVRKDMQQVLQKIKTYIEEFTTC